MPMLQMLCHSRDRCGSVSSRARPDIREGAKVNVPALYMVGDRDLIMALPGMDRAIANLANTVPRLRGKLVLADCGHWAQQERASEVNAAMISFLREL